jgi:hypothetical protein
MELRSIQRQGASERARISRIPVLQIENGADDAVPATQARPSTRRSPRRAKEFMRIDGASHYYLGQP